MTIRKIDPRDGIEVSNNDWGTISLSQDPRSGEEPAVVDVHPDDVDKLIGLLKDAKQEIRAKTGAQKTNDREELAENLLIDCVELLDEAAAEAFRHGDLVLESKCSRFSQYIAGFLGLEAPTTADDPERDVPSLP